jgi:hypothetical protein
VRWTWRRGWGRGCAPAVASSASTARLTCPTSCASRTDRAGRSWAMLGATRPRPAPARRHSFSHPWHWRYQRRRCWRASSGRACSEPPHSACLVS